jgi:hypothetical protein
VSGAVGLLLSDIWAWHDGTQTDRAEALAFGRALQSVNIFKDQEEDERNGMSFLPDAWGDAEILDYAITNLHIADNYVRSIPNGPARQFCACILALSWGVTEGRDPDQGEPLRTSNGSPDKRHRTRPQHHRVTPRTRSNGRTLKLHTRAPGNGFAQN